MFTVNSLKLHETMSTKIQGLLSKSHSNVNGREICYDAKIHLYWTELAQNDRSVSAR